MKYKVGEILIGQNFVGSPRLNDMECEVLEYGDYIAAFNNGVPCARQEVKNRYLVRWADGRETTTKERLLRRKRNPQELGSWEAIRELTNWNPSEVVA